VGSGAHPWHLDEETESILFLTNMSEKSARIGFDMVAGGVHYYLTRLKLKPHETRAIDLRKVRDEQKPDLNGSKVPAGAADGSVVWIRLDHVPVMGRLVVLQRHKSMASSYDCYICDCDPDFVDLDVDPASYTLLPDESATFDAVAWFREHCNSYEWPWYGVDASWTSLSPSVATIDAWGTVTGHTGGTATIKAIYGDLWFTYDTYEMDCVWRLRVMSAFGTAKVFSAQVTSVDLPSDQVKVTLGGPSGASGQLVVSWNGPGGNSAIDNNTRSVGSYTFNPPLGNLVTGQYTGVTAQWTVNGVTATGSKTNNFNVLGTWRHSQYNTPTESSCSGSSSSANEVNVTTCAYQTGPLTLQFINQAWLNGSGKTINSYYGYETEQNAQYCINHGYLPGDASGKSFAFEPRIIPYCGSSYSLGTNTVAWKFTSTSTLNCGDQVLIAGYGASPGTVKTVTDRCAPISENPNGCTNTQLDNYTTISGCAPRSVGDLGSFTTIRLGR